jgi:hypothetical protein
MIRRRVLFALPAVSFASARAFAQPVNPLPGMTTVTFPPGSTTSTLAGQLAPGGRNAYYVQAKAGQTLMVSVMPVATGVSFQVFKADASLAKVPTACRSSRAARCRMLGRPTTQRRGSAPSLATATT